MTEAERLAAAAANHIGARFRLHGRNPALGLDCVGLVHASLRDVGRVPQAPQSYRLRNSPDTDWSDFAKRSGLTAAMGKVVAGDVLMIRAGPAQQHLLIAASPYEFIHAHAGLRRIVRQRFDEPLRVIAHWRLSSDEKDQ